MVASCVPLTGDLAYNPGKCPDWESNQQPFGSQAGTQSTEPHQPGELPIILVLPYEIGQLTLDYGDVGNLEIKMLFRNILILPLLPHTP